MQKDYPYIQRNFKLHITYVLTLPQLNTLDDLRNASPLAVIYTLTLPQPTLIYRFL